MSMPTFHNKFIAKINSIKKPQQQVDGDRNINLDNATN